MVGKLNLDLGEDYAFDIRRAREVAEGAVVVIDTPFVNGPNQSASGQDYWLQRDADKAWYIWFDIDVDPDPDIRQPLRDFLSNPAVVQVFRDAVRRRARALGYTS